MLRFPQHYKALQDEVEKARIRDQVEKSIVLWAYQSDTKRLNQVLHKLYHAADGCTKQDTVNFCTNTWDRDIIPFKQCLIRIERYVLPSSMCRA